MARSGEEALKLVLQQEFAVILMDVNMPGMDGFETASLIRKRKKSSHTPIIFLTAFADEMRIAQGYASGAVDYIPTPVVPEILRAKVRVFIELSQMRAQAASQAEEYAMRKVAEEAVRNSSFLAGVSETLSRFRTRADVLRIITQISIPYLSDECILWLVSTDVQHEQMERAWLDADGKIQFAPHTPSRQDFSWLGKPLQKLLGTNQAQTLSQIPPTAFMQPDIVSQTVIPFMGSALILPITQGGQPNGVLMLLRKGRPYQPDEVSLANALASRVSIALENVMLMEKIREADKRKDEFLATLAHELRNPLAPIGNAVQILKMAPQLQHRKQAEEIIERQFKHMIHLVDDLMDVSRINQGKIDLRKERVVLKEIFDHALETAQPLIKERGHTLVMKLPDAPLYLEGDFRPSVADILQPVQQCGQIHQFGRSYRSRHAAAGSAGRRDHPR